MSGVDPGNKREWAKDEWVAVHDAIEKKGKANCPMDQIELPQRREFVYGRRFAYRVDVSCAQCGVSETFYYDQPPPSAG
jgi:hypothetical protein